MKKDLKIIVEYSGNEPDYYKMAHTLLEAARKFYNKPENERAYQEWIKEQRKANNQRNRNRNTFLIGCCNNSLRKE